MSTVNKEYPFKMKAVALTKYLPISDPDSLVDIELEIAQPASHDLLVKINAVSVNPVDTKVRTPKAVVEQSPKILGWDACGTVVSIGDCVTLFQPGDSVFYAGDITRQGSNSEYQLIDERIVGSAPTTISHEAAAAMPLTALTAWEAIFERLGVNIEGEGTPGQGRPKSLLIIGGAGGVGSIGIQLAAKLAGLNVIATASKPESIAWCQKMGAKHVINHHEKIADQLSTIGLPQVDYILCCNNIDMHFNTLIDIIKPQGHICSIVENTQPLALEKLKSKSVSFSWEFMFTRSMYKTEDMIEQHHILTEVARLIDKGILKTTLSQTLKPINAENLRQAHAIIEEGNMVGKLVLSAWV
jgi:zinc-binding alcohol dehydrogenase family protein